MKEGRERPSPYDITYMWKLKHGTNKLIYKIDSQAKRTDFWLPRRRRMGEGSIRSLGFTDANYYIQDG